MRWKKLLSIVQRAPCYGQEPDGIIKEKKTQIKILSQPRKTTLKTANNKSLREK